MSTLADSMLSWKSNLTTRATPEQVLTLRADVSAFADGVRLLESENAKLRELVADMWFWGYEGHMDSESKEWQIKHIDEVLDRMRELEIEVG